MALYCFHSIWHCIVFVSGGDVKFGKWTRPVEYEEEITFTETTVTGMSPEILIGFNDHDIKQNCIVLPDHITISE